jgi:hypothetical protein
VLLLLLQLLLLLLLLLLWERKGQVVGVLLTPSCASTQGHCASQQHLKRNKANGFYSNAAIATASMYMTIRATKQSKPELGHYRKYCK